MEKTKKISFSSMFRLSRRGGHTATKIITVLLSAFSFMLVAFSTMSFAYDKVDYITKYYSKIFKEQSYMTFVAAQKADGKTEDRSYHVVGLTEISELEQYDIDTETSVYYLGHCSWGSSLGTTQKTAYADIVSTEHGGDYGIWGSPEAYRALDFSVLAGDFPQKDGEIAISEAHFQAYRNRKLFVKGEGAVAVEKYEDVVGKVVQWSELAVYTIVGVIETGYDVEKDNDEYSPLGKIMFSDCYKEIEGYSAVVASYCAAPKDKATIKKYVKIADNLMRNGQADSVFLPNDQDLFYPIDVGIIADVEGNYYLEMGEDEVIAYICLIVGAFLCSFAILLNGHLTTQSILAKESKIGILRAMGTNKWTITQIIWVDVLLCALGTFILALCMLLGVYYGFFLEMFGSRSYFVFNGWTVLILAAICFGVPLLSSLLPLHKFFKKSIVENISGNESRQKK